MQNFIHFLTVLGLLHFISFTVDVVSYIWRFAKRALMARSSEG